MKLKNFCFKTMAILGLAIIISTKNNAQTTTKVNINIATLLSIKVNDAAVNLDFNTTDDYLNGVSTPMANHLTVSSILPYTIKVNAVGSTFNGTTTSSNTIDIGVLNIGITNTESELGVAPENPITLTTTAQSLVTDAHIALAKNIDVTYSIPSSKSDGSTTDIFGKPVDTYFQTITYQISN